MKRDKEEREETVARWRERSRMKRADKESNQAIIASVAVWSNQAMAQSKAESPEESSWAVPERPERTDDELVKVKLPAETPATWPALAECVTAAFAQLCDDYGGAHAVPQPVLPGRSCA